MAMITRSSRILKDDDSNNSKGKQISGSITSDTSSLRRSTRVNSSKKLEASSPSPSRRKSERIEKLTPQATPTKRKSERIENRSMPSSMSMSEGSEKHHSLNSSSSKKSVIKRSSSKRGINEKQLKLKAGDHTRRNEQNDLKPVAVVSKKKRLNARSYRAFLVRRYLKPLERKAKELDLDQMLKGHGDRLGHENARDNGSKDVEDDVKCGDRKEEEVRRKDSREGCKRVIEVSSSGLEEVKDEGERCEGKVAEVRGKGLGEGCNSTIEGSGSDSKEVEGERECSEWKEEEVGGKLLVEPLKDFSDEDDCCEGEREEVRGKKFGEGGRRAIERSISGSRKNVEWRLRNGREIEPSYISRKHENSREETCKSKNGDSSPASKNGDSSLQLSPHVVKSKKAIADADRMQVDCSTGEDLQKSDSVGSPSQGKSLPGDHDLESAVKVVAVKRKRLDMDFNASVEEDSEKICGSTAHTVSLYPSGSKEGNLSSRCVSCSKRQRVDFHSQNVVSFCHSQRNHDLCNTSFSEDICEQASSAITPQTGEMPLSCIQKDGTTRDVVLIDRQREDAADVDGLQLLHGDGRKAEYDQIDLPDKIAIPIPVEEDGPELEAAVCRGLTKECSTDAQLKDSFLDIQSESEQNACVVCKLGGKILCCDGNGCKKSYHLNCLNPPLKAVPPGAWYCLLCVKKRMESGAHSVSGGVESIWDAREVRLSNGEGTQKEYFVKYQGLAHAHNRWVPENQLLLDAPMLVAKFKENQDVSWNSEWAVPHRLLQKRLLMTPEQRDQYLSGHKYCKTKKEVKHLQWLSSVISNCHYEWFVKWRGLGYEHATWELENDRCFWLKSLTLKKDYESHRKRAKSASDPSRADKVLQEKSGPCFKLSKLPGIGKPGLHNDHLCFVNNLRECWHKTQNAVVMEEKERVIKVILFILSLQSNVCRPFLIISTSSALSVWEAELMRLAPSVNVVVYNGNKDVRETIRMLEFYEEGCTMFQVLLSHPDAIVEDLEVLECLGWETIVVDECQQSSVSKHFKQIKMLTTDFKVLLVSGPIQDSMVEYLNLLSFIDSEVDWNITDNLKVDSNFNIGKLKERFARFVASRRKSDSSEFVEYWVPVRLSNVQLEQYCATLLSNSMSLRSCLKNDPVGAVRDILISTRKCCDHPYIVDPSLQSLIAKGLPEEYLDVGVNASGKLQILDKILYEILKRGLRALILFQSIGGSGRNHIGDILDDFLCQRFGPESYERVDSGLLTSKKQTTLNMFNNKEKGRFVFLIENRACQPSIKLSSVDIAILFDSDWNPLNDLRALQRITIDSEFEQLKVFRLYSSSTLEEKVLILAKQDMALDSNVHNISCSTSHMLLKWGASYLFKKLDEFHGCNLSHGSVISSEQSLLNDVMQELLSQLPNDAGESNTSDCSFILKVKLSGLSYSSDISLPGKLEMQSTDEEPPHVFWPKLLEGRCPQWRYLTEPSPRVRKKVQYFDELRVRSEVDNDDIAKRRKKVVNNTFDLASLKSSVEGKRKVVSVNNEVASETPASNGSQLLPRSTVNLDSVRHPNINSKLPDGHIAESEESRNLCDSQKNLHLFLKPEISKLCEILRLPEDVKDVTGKFLEYIMKNHHVSREPATILQAFQISLCWTAASLLKQKMNRQETLALAKQHLNFECKDEEAEFVYSILRKLKKMFARRAENAVESSSAEGPSRTYDAAEHLVDGKASQAAASNQQEMEAGVIRESSQSQPCSSQRISANQEQATDCKKIEGSQKNDTSTSILQVKKIHSRRMKKLLKKQMDEYTEFNKKKHKIMENSKARLEKEHKMELALIRAIHSQVSVRSDKLKILDQDFTRKIKELNSRVEIQQKKLEDMQLAARIEEKRRKSYWLREAKSGRPVASFSGQPLPDSGFRLEDMESSEQVGVSDGPEKVTLISGPSAVKQDTDGTGPIVPGETVVAEAPKIVQIEALEGVVPTEPQDFAVHSLEKNDTMDTTILERDTVHVVEQCDSGAGASNSGGSPSLENTGINSPLAQVLPVEESQLFVSARLQGEDMSNPVLQNSSPQVEVSSLQSAEALPSDHSIHGTLVVPTVVQLQLHLPTDPPSSEHSQPGSLACTVERSANNERLTASEQFQFPAQPPVQDQAELFNHSVSQPETQLERDHQSRHTSSRLDQVPTQPQAEDQAELFSHSVPQYETQLECDNRLRHTPSQQAQVPIQPSESEISVQPAFRDLAELFDQPLPQPETQFERDRLFWNTSSQEVQLQIQPPAEIYVELHNILQSNSQSQLHTSMERPSSGSRIHIPETRTSGGLSEPSNRPLHTAPVTPWIPQPEPLQNELARIRREEDQVMKIHEDLKTRINSECEKEIEEIRRKYNNLRHDAETTFVHKRKALETFYNKVYMNRILAEVFRFKCSQPRAAGVPGFKQGAPPEFMQQLLQMSSQQNAQRPVSGAGSPAATPSAPRTQVVHHSSALFSSNPARPRYNSVGPPTGTYQVGGEVRGPAPHLQPFRPSTSMSAPNHHSLSSALRSQQSLSIPAATSVLPHLTTYPSNCYSSGLISRTHQSETEAGLAVSHNTSWMHELPRNIDNGPSMNPPNLFTPQTDLGLTSVTYGLSELATNGNLQVPAANVGISGDIVCLSDDD